MKRLLWAILVTFMFSVAPGCGSQNKIEEPDNPATKRDPSEFKGVGGAPPKK